MYALQRSHASLKQRVSDQAQDISRVVRITSSDISSSEAATPDRSFSFAVPRRTVRSNEASPTGLTPPAKIEIPVSLSSLC